MLGKLAEQLKACLVFVFNLLGHKNLGLVGVILAEHRQKAVKVVVFAAKAQNQHTARIGVVGKAGQQLLGGGVVFAKLAATHVVGKGMHPVHQVAKLLLGHFGKASRR